MSTVVLSLLLEITRLYGGFFTSPSQLDQYTGWRFADALSYLKYTFVGVALNELHGLKLDCVTSTGVQVDASKCITTGEQIAASKGYDEYTVGFCAGIMIVYIIGTRLVAFLALRYIKS
jgi:ATP-binding cassette, subfamily G (WHITE), member 2